MSNRIFNRTDRVVEGWYWALPSKALRPKRTKAIELMGKKLVLFRGESGRVHAMDAFCPHMGAHLAEGKVEGDSLRCFFHAWKFSEKGECLDIPCLKQPILVKPQPTWPTAERYGLIWVWAGKESKTDVPCVPELEGLETDWLLGNRFEKNCHPNVMMINAIDEQHFHSVHPMVREIAGGIGFKITQKSPHCLVFQNGNQVPATTWYTRLLGKFYGKAATYDLSYWYGTNGTVTIGPDFLHFYIIFALRPTPEGRSEGQTILVTKKRHGFFGKLFNWFILRVTRVVGGYFARGDTKIFKTIRFELKTPIQADHSILAFASHLEKQTPVEWGMGKLPIAPVPASKPVVSESQSTMLSGEPS
ncbi:aromatic ring-hydroxylating dioxygenase subunit alpha [bacterium]|nr:aromatic ring-hydroxylating dioxygenase subunit alpha [bacterium]